MFENGGLRVQPQFVLTMFLFWRKFQPHCSYKIVLIKKSVLDFPLPFNILPLTLLFRERSECCVSIGLTSSVNSLIRDIFYDLWKITSRAKGSLYTKLCKIVKGNLHNLVFIPIFILILNWHHLGQRIVKSTLLVFMWLRMHLN